MFTTKMKFVPQFVMSVIAVLLFLDLALVGCAAHSPSPTTMPQDTAAPTIAPTTAAPAPTATFTALPPTNTPIPPTKTPVPSTATPTKAPATPTPTPEVFAERETIALREIFTPELVEKMDKRDYDEIREIVAERDDIYYAQSQALEKDGIEPLPPRPPVQVDFYPETFAMIRWGARLMMVTYGSTKGGTWRHYDDGWYIEVQTRGGEKVAIRIDGGVGDEWDSDKSMLIDEFVKKRGIKDGQQTRPFRSMTEFRYDNNGLIGIYGHLDMRQDEDAGQ